ncbi:MAG: DUF4912 domain-containing protein [Spirochaetota bacterium]
MTRERLAGLSEELLQKLADKLDVDIPDEAHPDEIVDLVTDALEEAREEHEQSNNNAIRVEERKYQLARFFSEKDLATVVDDTILLPDRYNETRMHLMVRDPAWAFCYWDVRDEQLVAVTADPEFQELILRIVEMDNPDFDDHTVVDSFEIPVRLNDKSRYINLPRQDASYYTELSGLCGERHISICRSNPISVPRGGLPDTVTEAGPVDERKDRVLALSGLEHLGVPRFGSDIPGRIISLIDRYADSD